MSSTPGSTTPSAEAARVRTAAVVTHGRPRLIQPALERLEAVAREAGVELVLPSDECKKHGREPAARDPADAELAVVLGGDGTMLRALQRFLGTRVPVIGVNFGRVGFLASIQADELESGLARAFAGDYAVVELPTLEAEIGHQRVAAVNDVVALSAERGRMVELGWAIAGEELGVVPCDGVVCATPSGSTAYNLSIGGPVLMWGLDAMAITFVAPHSLHLRPLVVPRSRDLVVTNRTVELGVAALVDGHSVGIVAPGGQVTVRLGPQRSLLATLPERTFFRRYSETFTH